MLAVTVLIGAGIGIAIAASASGVHPKRVVSRSMSPAVRSGDWIVLRDLGRHDRSAIRRGDIVLFRLPFGTTGRAVKRVVAIAGDKVAISARSVTIRDKVIPIAGAPSKSAARQRVEAVARGHVFLLGDNAAVSIDSRSFGPVPETELVGRVLFVIPQRTLVWVIALAAVITAIAMGLLVARRHRRRAAGR